jgi:DNA-binding CsgD family transcriptional regulator
VDNGEKSPLHRRVLKLADQGKTPSQIAAKVGMNYEQVTSILKGPTPTRQRILELTAQGHKPRFIALVLGISVQAVHGHLKRHREVFGKVPRRVGV